MTPELLENFLLVAKYGNISRAADILYLNGSSLSRQMSRLEEYYGVPLFVRNNRSVSLTESGKVLASDAPAILEKIEELRLRVRRAGTSGQKTLTVATLDVANTGFNTASRAFRMSNPDVDLFFRSLPPGNITQCVLDGDADVGVESSTKVSEHIGKFDWFVLDDVSFCVLVHQGHPLSGRDSVSIEDLKNERFVTMDLEPPGQFYKVFGEESELLRALFATSSVVKSWQDMITQVETGAGVAVLPSIMAGSYRSTCVKLPLASQKNQSSLIMFWIKNNNSPTLRRFVDFISARLGFSEALPD